MWTDADEVDGFKFVQVSHKWKERCLNLPCNKEIYFPMYATKVIDTTIDGKAVVIQLWKGRCEKLLGGARAPGGIGAEVGIYCRKAKAKASDGAKRLIVEKGAEILFGRAERERDAKAAPVSDDIFYPYPALKTQLWWKLTNPKTGEEFFHTPSTVATYWHTRWMDPVSYEKYKQQGHDVPLNPASYTLHYKINHQYQLSW